MLRAAATLPAIVVTSPLIAIAAPGDAELIALGERFQRLFLENIGATFQWAPLSRAAHAEVRRKFKFVEWADLSSHEEVEAASQLLSRITERNGCEVASDRMSALTKEINPLAEAIVEAEASTLGGLRAKALVVLWEAMPTMGFHEGAFEFPDDAVAVRCGGIARRADRDGARDRSWARRGCVRPMQRSIAPSWPRLLAASGALWLSWRLLPRGPGGAVG